MEPLSIAIFGAGVAGLTVAAALEARGRVCRVYERRRASETGGMGFILSPEAMADLDEVGVTGSAMSRGIRLQRFLRYAPDGELRHVDEMPAGWRGVRRTDVIEALEHRLRDATVVYEAELAQLTLEGRGAVTGATLATRERIQADLYIAADGARSRARHALVPWWPQRQARVLEIVGVLDDPQVSAWAGRDFHKFCAPGVAVGVLPVGDGTVVWFIQFDRERFPPPVETAASRARLAHDLVGAWPYPVPRLLAATACPRTHMWHPIDCDLPPMLHTVNLVLLGDAAHPLLPFTSQGVAAAIAGARDLAAALDTTDSLDIALTMYSASCRARCAPYVARGRHLSQQFLARDEPAALPIAI